MERSIEHGLSPEATEREGKAVPAW
jgi:hypothetical protein